MQRGQNEKKCVLKKYLYAFVRMTNLNWWLD